MKKLLLVSTVLLCAISTYGQVDVLVQRYDSSSTNQNLNETTLTMSNVNSANFGKLYSFNVDGYVYAQPLYKANLAIPGNGIHNVVFIATQHDSVYAFDADTATPLWKTSFINSSAGVTTQPSADTGTTDIIPEVGITSTPVIDPISGTMYVAAKTKENGSAVFRIHALDITTGAERVTPVFIQASVPQTGGGTLSFNANWQQQRPGLILYNGVVYVGFGSSGDNFTWQGWLLGYNSTTLAQTVVFCVDPSSASGGIWAAGQAPPIDANGNIYIATGNGNFNGTSDFGDSYLKLSTASNLTVLDYFAPFNQGALNTADLDIASAGATLLPDSAGTASHPHIMVAAGKDGTIYVLDRDNMGKYNGSYTNPDSQIIQEIPNAIGILPINIKAIPMTYVENNYTSPAFWQNRLYFCGINDVCRLFNFTNGLLSTKPASQSATSYPFGGAQPVITASSPTATSGVMWAVERNTTNNITVLHAYDATNLATEIYNSNQAAGNRDQGGAPVKFVVPTVTNGKVFVGSQYQVDVYGLLTSNPSRLPAPTFTPRPGTYTTAQSVSISDTNTSAQIFYTLNGSIPTASSTLYTGPIAISNTTTVNAIAVLTGMLTSPVASGTFTIGSLGTTGGFVQGNYAVPHGAITSVNVPFLTAQGSGNLNLVAVGWNDTTSSVASVTDTNGNVYTLAVGPTLQSVVGSQSIYYANNIVAGGNSITVAFNAGAKDPDIRIAEYGGLDPNNPLDVTAASQGNSTNSSSGPATTTSATELIVGANLVQTGTTGPGPNFINRMITNPDADILEDMVVTTTGSYSASAPVSPSGQWIMQMVTFKGAGSTPRPTAPSNLTPTVISSTQINLSWTASTEAGGTISLYLVERCSGSGCSNFAQVGTSATTIFNDTALTATTSYSYRVRAQDTANNIGPYSSVVTATTLAAITPTAPTNLTATPGGSTQITLSWGASTESGGSISQYLVERCAGSSCSNFSQIAASTVTTFTDTSLLGSTSYSYRVRAQDNSSNNGPYSNVASATTAPPTFTAPTNLTATPVSSTQINLAWTAATETGGTITNYLVERCSGSGCSAFVQVATPVGTAYSDTNLLASTPYSYRVRATDISSNLGPYSTVASATTPSAPPPPTIVTLVQQVAKRVNPGVNSTTQTFNAVSTTGNLIVVSVKWGDQTTSVTAVGDNKGNTYTSAVGPTNWSGTAKRGQTFYAKNIIGGGSPITISVTLSKNSTSSFYVYQLEYTGADINAPVDATTAAIGNSTAVSSGPATTLSANDLIYGFSVSDNSTLTAGAGFTAESILGGNLVEDKMVNTTGSYSATATATPASNWFMQMVAIKAAVAVTPTAPSGLTATTSGPTQINLSWTAATETSGTISQYLVERCSGSGCSNFVQIGTTAATIYNDTPLLGSTSYSYRVRAMDTNNNTGPYSNTATATTAAPTFTAPSGLTATASGPVQANLAWTAATETGGTITQYLIERCTGASCTTFAQVGTSTTLTFTDNGLSGSTTYTYQVRATDGTNFSGYSNTSSATTAAPTFTAPSNLTPTVASNTQINLSWTAATETGATISQYLIERCSGANCGNTPSNFTQVGTSATLTYNDTGLTPSTSYSYRVRATDGTNFSGYSNIVTASTPAALPTPPGSLTAVASGPVQVNLSWTASTEAGGSISQYLVERCSGPGCSNFVQVGTSPTTTYSDATGLLGSTSYSYRVRAQDATSNNGPYSNTATATTAAPTFTAPSGLTATASGPVQANLAWTAATETGGTITQYLIERCTGASCTTFAQVGTSTTLTFTDNGLSGSTTYTYRVRATDGTNFSGYSNTSSATTAAPTFTAPSNLTPTVASNTQINLSWTAATETGGTITQYLIETCVGSACANFTQIGTSTTTTFSNTGLLAGTTYVYRVRATDGTNLSGYSNTATATTTSAPPPPITFIQGNFSTPQTPQSSVPVTYTAAQGSGDLNVVIVGWNDSTATVNAVTDTLGNVYVPALVPTVQAGIASQVIYYAKNIAGAAANANTVTVAFNGSAAYPDIRILEYSGIDVTSPLDVTAASSGSSTTSSSGAVTTTFANDLIIGANLVQTGTTGAGSGFTARMITNPDSDIAEDRIVTATGSYTATAPISPSAQWIMQLVAFRRHP